MSKHLHLSFHTQQGLTIALCQTWEPTAFLLWTQHSLHVGWKEGLWVI